MGVGLECPLGLWSPPRALREGKQTWFEPCTFLGGKWKGSRKWEGGSKTQPQILSEIHSWPHPIPGGGKLGQDRLHKARGIANKGRDLATPISFPSKTDQEPREVGMGTGEFGEKQITG